MPQLASLHLSRVIFPAVEDVSGDAAVLHQVATWLAASPSTSRALHLCLDTGHAQKCAEYFDTVLSSLAPLRGHLRVLVVEYYCLSRESLKAVNALLPGPSNGGCLSKLLLIECDIDSSGAGAKCTITTRGGGADEGIRRKRVHPARGVGLRLSLANVFRDVFKILPVEACKMNRGLPHTSVKSPPPLNLTRQLRPSY